VLQPNHELRMSSTPAGAKTVNFRPSAGTRSARGWRVLLMLLLAAGFLLTVVVFYPGYITVDAQYVYDDAKGGRLGDWQSPAMGALWLLIDPMAPGSVSMFLLTTVLYWTSFTMLAFIALRRSVWLGLLTPFAALLPPAFFFLGMIGRDVLFGIVWLTSGMLAFFFATSRAYLRAPMQLFALLLVIFGVLLRPNAIPAASVLVAYVMWPARLDFRRAVIAFAPVMLALVVLVPVVYYGVLGAKRQNPLHSILVFDLGGITYFTGENQFPVSWTAEQTAMLRSSCYDPVRWDSYWHVPPCPFVMQRLERPDDVIFGKPLLVQAWRHALIAHPLAYLAHRATFMGQFLARSNLVLPYLDWEKPGATYGQGGAFQAMLRLHQVLAPSFLFRPGLWLILAVAIAAWAWPGRQQPNGAFAVAVTSCAAVYVASFFFFGVAADFRYAYWCVLAVISGGIAAGASFRGEANVEAHAESPD
jgi:hypothetical protein